MTHQHHQKNAHDKNLRMAFMLNLGFAVFEVFGGFWTNSMAILSDALHDMGDSLSLGIAWLLERTSRKGRDKKYSYGYKRFSMLGALINTIILIGGSLFILSEAVPRLLQPEPSKAPGMVIFACIGILVNGFAVMRLRKDQSMNARVVTLHLLEDVMGWSAVLVVSITLLFTDLYILDSILSILITLFILFQVIRNMRTTLSLFLQAIPENIDVDKIEDRFLDFNKVKSSHHTHCWSLDGQHHVLTSHVVVASDTNKDEVLEIKCKIKELANTMGFEHLTLEIEYEGEKCSMQ